MCETEDEETDFLGRVVCHHNATGYVEVWREGSLVCRLAIDSCLYDGMSSVGERAGGRVGE